MHNRPSRANEALHESRRDRQVLLACFIALAATVATALTMDVSIGDGYQTEYLDQ